MPSLEAQPQGQLTIIGEVRTCIYSTSKLHSTPHHSAPTMAPRADHLVLHETDEADNHTAVFIYSEPSDSSKLSPARVDISVRQRSSAFVVRLSNMQCPTDIKPSGDAIDGNGRHSFSEGLLYGSNPSDLVGCSGASSDLSQCLESLASNAHFTIGSDIMQCFDLAVWTGCCNTTVAVATVLGSRDTLD